MYRQSHLHYKGNTYYNVDSSCFMLRQSISIIYTYLQIILLWILYVCFFIIQDIAMHLWPTMQGECIIGISLINNCMSHMWLQMFNLQPCTCIWLACHNQSHTHKRTKEDFHHQSIAPSINYYNTTAKSWLVCFFWSLFLRPARHPWMCRCLLSITGWLIQAATLLEITTYLIDNTGHRSGYILWHFECNVVLVKAISPWILLSVAEICHFVAPHYLLFLYKCLWCW